MYTIRVRRILTNRQTSKSVLIEKCVEIPFLPFAGLGLTLDGEMDDQVVIGNQNGDNYTQIAWWYDENEFVVYREEVCEDDKWYDGMVKDYTEDGWILVED